MGGKKAILDAMWSTKPMAAPLLPLLPAEVTMTRGTWPLARQLAAPRSRRREVQHARVPALTQRQLALPAAQALPCVKVCSGTQNTSSSSTDACAQCSHKWLQGGFCRNGVLSASSQATTTTQLLGGWLKHFCSRPLRKSTKQGLHVHQLPSPSMVALLAR